MVPIVVTTDVLPKTISLLGITIVVKEARITHNNFNWLIQRVSGRTWLVRLENGSVALLREDISLLDEPVGSEWFLMDWEPGIADLLMKGTGEA